MASGPEQQGSVPASSSTSSSKNRTDPGWKYVHPVEENNTNDTICNFCSKIMKGGITRAKEHLIGKSGNVSKCIRVPKEVKEELIKYMKQKKSQCSEEVEVPNARELDLENLGFGLSEEDAEGIDDIPNPKPRMRRGAGALKGPMDLFVRNPKTAIGKRNKEKLRQQNIREACDKEAVERVHQYIARWWYQAGIPFNCIKLKSFHDMLAAIGSFGPNLPPPSYHAIRVPLLNKEMEHTKNMMKNHKEQWKKHGCSIMSDAWTDRKQRSIINFLVNSPAGTMFIRSIDGSDFVKTGEKLFELLNSLVEEIGEENVVQIITDNGSNYVLAGKMLEEKRPHLYWTPCVAHCLDLMLEDIGKIPLIKKTIKRAIFLVGFIYSHTSTLSLLRQFTNKKELVRHAITRFATSFLSLERLREEKQNLTKMFTSDEWVRNKLSKEAKGKEATKIAIMPSFWNHVRYTLKVMRPLVQVLRLVDGERKPAMGYIYEAMDKAKEAIMKSFNNDESKYKDVFAIIDKRWNCQLHRPLHAAGHFLNPEFYYGNPDLEFDLEVTNGLYECIRRLVPSRDVQQKILIELPLYKNGDGLFGSDFARSNQKTIAPAQWWRMYGHSTPNLQKLAIKILSLTCSASGCERNWSVFEQIHTKKRNRLEHKRMEDLVFVKYNQALKQRYNIRDEIDPISLNDIDECNEWMVGELIDEENAGEELVFEGDETLNWETVFRASGIGEPTTNTRHQSKKRMATSGEGQSSRASKKGKQVVVAEEEPEEPEFEDIVETEEEEEEIMFDDSESEREQGDGYGLVGNKDNDDDNYFGEDED